MCPTQQTQAKKTQTQKSSRRISLKKREAAVREVSAGGVVFRRYGKQVCLALMMDPYKKWTFPKGRVEKSEDLEEAAARETLEELGLQEIRFWDDLGQIDIWFRDRFEKQGKLVHKDIHFFLFETPHNAKLEPNPDEHAMAAKWVPIQKVRQVSSYADMNPIVERAIELVKKIVHA